MFFRRATKQCVSLAAKQMSFSQFARGLATNGNLWTSCQLRRHFSGELISEKKTLEKAKMAASESEGKRYETFDSMPIDQRLKDYFKQRRFSAVSDVQNAVFDLAVKGDDMIVRARTGTGKTIAFTLPLVTKILRKPKAKSQQPYVLIMAPTRELAIQINQELKSESNALNGAIRSVALYGGSNIEESIRRLKEGAEFVVATPGRLKDLIQRGAINFSDLEHIVLDETDEMLNIGFKRDIEQVIEVIKQQRGRAAFQVMLFSATMPKWVELNASSFMNKAKLHKINLIRPEDEKCPSTVQHLKIYLPQLDRDTVNEYCTALVSEFSGTKGRTLIFTNRIEDANDIAQSESFDVPTGVLHSGITQAGREDVFTRFNSGKIKCLVATNVAARGLDFPAIELIIQVGVPETSEVYVHRAGRTARAGRSGVCATIYDSSGVSMIEQIQKETMANFEEYKKPTPEKFMEIKTLKQVPLLRLVRPDYLKAFGPAVKEILSKYSPEEAVGRLLGVCCDFTGLIGKRSAFLAKEDYVTMKLTLKNDVNILDNSHAETYINDSTPFGSISESIEDICLTADRKAIVFNLRRDSFEPFELAAKTQPGLSSLPF